MLQKTYALKMQHAIRDQLSSIEKIQEKQRMVTQRGDLDVLGIAVDTSMACVQLLFIRGGRLLGRENYFVQHDGDSQETIMTDFISSIMEIQTSFQRNYYYLWIALIETC